MVSDVSAALLAITMRRRRGLPHEFSLACRTEPARGSREQLDRNHDQEDLAAQLRIERAESCWQQANLRVLAERGKGSRLTAFLEAVSTRLIPILAGDTAP